MNYTIRKATYKDREDFIKILKLWNMHHAFLKDEVELDYSYFYVAQIDDRIVGLAGFVKLTNERYRTRLLAVYPEFQGSGIGKKLQEKRLEKIYELGGCIVETITDRDETILWYQKHFGCKKVGELKKEYENSLQDKDYMVVLELDLEQYMLRKDEKKNAKELYMANDELYPLVSYPPLIINVALTGVIPTKLLNLHAPIFIDEIIEDAIKVHDAGASIVHLHARNESGESVSDARFFEEIISGIRRERPNLICCATTSGRGGQSFEQRSEVLHLHGIAKPDMASLSLGSLNFLTGASVNSLETIQRLAMLMKEKDIKPEMEVFDGGMINVAKYLEKHNLISGIKYFNILLGNLNTAAATLKDLAHIYTSLPNDSIWSCAGLGQFQLPMNMASIIAGGHVRVGLEDNIYYDNEKNILASNEMFVKRMVKIANELERPISTTEQTRELLQL